MVGEFEGLLRESSKFHRTTTVPWSYWSKIADAAIVSCRHCIDWQQLRRWHVDLRARLCRGFAVVVAVAIMVLVSSSSGASQRLGRPLSLEDVLDLNRIDGVAASPDGEWAAVVVQRAARPGEVYGRTYYELDPSRNDIWLVSRRSGERRNITQGAKLAAGFWCATWSPDGSKLAMLSTMPEGAEPRGGDNVRLYVWDRATGALTRADDAPILTQTRTPLYRLDLRGGVGEGAAAHRCHYDENAPFAWIGNDRLLAVMLPPDQVSGLIDEYSRPARQATDTVRLLREGREPTFTAMGSGAARMPRDERANMALLRIVDVATRRAETIATVPTYPFRGDLTLNISPDRRRIAILATLGTISPVRGQRIPYQDGSWAVEKRLGFVELVPGSLIRWAEMPLAARYPLELFGWSPDGDKVALRARAAADRKETPLFVASADDLSVERAGASGKSVGSEDAGSDSLHEPAVFWIDNQRLIARVADGSIDSGPMKAAPSRNDWWLFAPNGPDINITAEMAEPPQTLRRSAERKLMAVSGGKLMVLGEHGFETIHTPHLPANSSIMWPMDAGQATSEILISSTQSDGGQSFNLLSLKGSAATISQFTLPHAAELVGLNLAGAFALSTQATKQGLFLRETSLADGKSHDLWSLDSHLAAVHWGRTMLIDYRGAEDQPLKAAGDPAARLQAGPALPGHHMGLWWIPCP